MNTIIILVIVIIILYFYTKTESLENTESDSYYIDASGQKHDITDLPITVNNIIELKYTNTLPSSNIKFVTTKGSYKTIKSENQINIINNKQTMYQLLHLSNNIPFSGILF